VKHECWGAGMVMCLGQGAGLHMVQLMPLPLTISCFSKSGLVLLSQFYLLVPAHMGGPKQSPTHIHTQPFYGSTDFVRNNPGEPVPEETFTHAHLSWSSIVPYLLLPSNTKSKRAIKWLCVCHISSLFSTPLPFSFIPSVL